MLEVRLMLRVHCYFEIVYTRCFHRVIIVITITVYVRATGWLFYLPFYYSPSVCLINSLPNARNSQSKYPRERDVFLFILISFLANLSLFQIFFNSVIIIYENNIIPIHHFAWQ